MDRVGIKSQARDKIPPVRGSYICIILLIAVATFLVNYFAERLNVLGVASLYDLLIAPMMTIALIAFSLAAWRGQSPKASNWLDAIFERYGRKLGGYLWMVLRLLVWYIPLIVLTVILLTQADLTVVRTVGDYYKYIVNHGQRWLYLALYLVCMAFVIYRSYAFYFTTYILADCPNVTAREASSLSLKMTKGCRWQLFVAELSFLGWILLGALTLGILIIVFVGPYMNLTFAGFYEKIKEEKLKSGELKPADFGETEIVEVGEQA